MRFARVYQGVVVSVLDVPAGRTIDQQVGENQAPYYTDVPKYVEVGFVENIDGTFSPPKEVETVK
jgi:hypothetical protein